MPLSRTTRRPVRELLGSVVGRPVRPRRLSELAVAVRDSDGGPTGPRTARTVQWIPIHEVGSDGGIRISVYHVSHVFTATYGNSVIRAAVGEPSAAAAAPTRHSRPPSSDSAPPGRHADGDGPRHRAAGLPAPAGLIWQEPGGRFHRAPHGVRTTAVTRRPREPARAGPAAVAVHDQAHVQTTVQRSIRLLSRRPRATVARRG